LKGKYPSQISSIADISSDEQIDQQISVALGIKEKDK